MKMASRNHNRTSIIFAITVLLCAMLACGKTTETADTQKPTHTPESIQAEDNLHTNNSASDHCLAGIIVGETKRNQVVDLLGEPLGSEMDGDMEILIYSSSLPRQYHSVVIENDLVVFLSVILDEDHSRLVWSDVVKEYGTPQSTTYSNYLQGSMTYIYPYAGQAFVADPEIDAVFIRQCFKPMILNEYMSTWGAGLPTEDPFTK